MITTRASRRGHRSARDEGEAARAYRRAWWSLALYPVAFVAAFVTGEGLLSALGTNAEDAAWWQILIAATTALLIFLVPGALALRHGRAAVRRGRRDAYLPAAIGIAVGLAFVVLNLASFLAGVLFG